MELTLLDEVISTDYGQFELIWGGGTGFDGDFDRFFRGQDNGLVGAADPGGVYLNLARRSGGSPVRIVLVDTPPAESEPLWEDVVEVSISLSEADDIRWCSWAGEHVGAIAGLSAGTYRMRVSARGRDAGRADELAREPVDFYLAQLWLAPAEPDAVLRVGSRDAAYWHAKVGSRRA